MVSLYTPAFIDREALVDPHEDMIIVDYLVGTGKDGYAVEGGFAFKDFEFTHIAPGFKVVTAQNSADRDVCPHKLFPHGIRHTFERGEGSCMDKRRAARGESDYPIIYFAAFFYSQKGSHFPVGFDRILELGSHAYRFSGHYLQQKSHRAVGPAADPQAGWNLKALQFFQKIRVQKDTSG